VELPAALVTVLYLSVSALRSGGQPLEKLIEFFSDALGLASVAELI
jgi:hypothetical protein